MLAHPGLLTRVGLRTLRASAILACSGMVVHLGSDQVHLTAVLLRPMPASRADLSRV